MENQSILLVTPEKDLEQFISLQLEGRLPVDVVHLRDAKDATDRLSKGMTYSVIIIDGDLLLEEVYELYEANKEKGNIPLINIYEGDDPQKMPDFEDFFSNSKYNRVLLKSNIETDLVDVFTDVFRRVNKKYDDHKPVVHNGKKLIRVKTSYFLKLTSVESDVFLQLPSGKFLKIIRAGSEISTETIENVYRKGGEFLYQEEADFLKLSSLVFDKLKSRLKDRTLSNQEKIQVQIQSIKHVQDVVRSMGINEATIDMTDEIVDSVRELAMGNKNLAKIVKMLLKSKSHNFVRSSLVNYLVGGIVYQAGWDSINTMKKLVYASVFCDFGFELSEEPLSEIVSKESDAFKRLSKEDQKIVLAHPEKAVKFLEKNNNLLTDEVNIVLQHHEKPNGKGFPKGLNYNQIPPLSCAFILCYDFAIELIKRSREKEVVEAPEIFEFLGPDYSKANFAKPYMALKKALQVQ